MSLDQHDPKLTAYVLGELGPAEAAEVKAAVAASPELARATEEIRETAGRLTSALAAEATPRLSDSQRAAILAHSAAAGNLQAGSVQTGNAQVGEPQTVKNGEGSRAAAAPRGRSPRRFGLAVAGMAASLLLVGVGYVLWQGGGVDAARNEQLAMLGRKNRGADTTEEVGAITELRSIVAGDNEQDDASPRSRRLPSDSSSTVLRDEMIRRSGRSGKATTDGIAGDDGQSMRADPSGAARGDRPAAAKPTGGPNPGDYDSLANTATTTTQPESWHVPNSGQPAPQPPASSTAGGVITAGDKGEDEALGQQHPLQLMVTPRIVANEEMAPGARRRQLEAFERGQSERAGKEVADYAPIQNPDATARKRLSEARGKYEAVDKLSGMARSPASEEQLKRLPRLSAQRGTEAAEELLGTRVHEVGDLVLEGVNRSGGGLGGGGLGAGGQQGGQSGDAKQAGFGVAESLTEKEDSRVTSSPTTDDNKDFFDAAGKPVPPPAAEASEPADTSNEQYAPIIENPFVPIVDPESAMSTFSIDVDTASYSNVRRFLTAGQLPPPDAVRVEELLNYFNYDYSPPTGEVPFSVHVETAGCPWKAGHRLVRIGLRGRDVSLDDRPPANVVFLLDISGSMRPANKLPLVKEAMKMLVEQFDEGDRVAIVTYASQTAIALPSTSGDNYESIVAAINALSAGGSTNGSGGIQMAYETALQGFLPEGTNRVILATDGDFNVGITGDDQLEQFIRQQATSGVFLTTLGFGMGNIKDAKLERLADRGNGNYAYIDDLVEARKVLIEEAAGTLFTIAKDVKLQLEFNPAEVHSYRLIGYENRVLPHEDFHDDTKDAGEIGAGHTVTALYEIVPAAVVEGDVAGGSKYQAQPALTEAARTGELLTLKLRYKQPDADTSQLIEVVAKDAGKRYGEASDDFKFAAAVASFGLLLRGSQYAGDATFEAVVELAPEGLGADEKGYRQEFVELVRRAQQLARSSGKR